MADAWSDENDIPDEDASIGDLAGLFDFALDPSDRASDAWDAHLPSVQKAIADGYDLLAERPLGAGAFAEVWPAQEKRSQITVAVKAVRASDKLTPDACESVQVAEFELVRDHLHNLNVPRALHLGGRRDQTYVVFEWVEGRPLLEAADAMNSVEDKLALAERTLETVAGIHGVGVVHADLKPEHFLVRHDGQVMCMDFGLAHRPVAPDLGLVKRQQFGGGTGPYMAPELQTLTPDRANGRTDVYALGKVLMQVLLPVSAWPKDLLDDPGSTQADAMEASVPNPMPDPSEAWADSVGDKSQAIDATHASQQPFAKKVQSPGGSVFPKVKPEALPPKWCQTLLATMVDPVPSRRPLDAKLCLQAWQRRARQAAARKQQARRMAWVLVLLVALVLASVLGFWAGRPAQWPVFQRFFAPEWQDDVVFKDTKLQTPITWPDTNQGGDHAQRVWQDTSDPFWHVAGQPWQVQRRQLVAHDGVTDHTGVWLLRSAWLGRGPGVLPLLAWVDAGGNVLVADLASGERWLLDNVDNGMRIQGLAWFEPALQPLQKAARQLVVLTSDGRLFVYDLDKGLWLVHGAVTPCSGNPWRPKAFGLYGDRLVLLGSALTQAKQQLWQTSLGHVLHGGEVWALTGEVGRWQTLALVPDTSVIWLAGDRGWLWAMEPGLANKDALAASVSPASKKPNQATIFLNRWRVLPAAHALDPAGQTPPMTPIWEPVLPDLGVHRRESLTWVLHAVGEQSIVWAENQADSQGESSWQWFWTHATHGQDATPKPRRQHLGETRRLDDGMAVLCESLDAVGWVVGSQLLWFNLYDGAPMAVWALPPTLEAKDVEHLDWDATENTLNVVGKQGMWQWRLVPLSH